MGSVFTPGRFVWRELLSQDPASSSRFYSELFDGSFDARDPQHAQISSSGTAIGGLVQVPYPSLPTFWQPYVSVADVEASAKLAVAAGCTQTAGPVESQGDVMVLSDPQGAAFGVRHAAMGDPAVVAKPAPGSFCWEQLSTPDAAASLAIYSATFGWSHAAFRGQEGMSVFSLEGTEVASVMQGPVDMPAHWLSYVAVDALSSATARASRLGGSVLIERVELPGPGAFAVLQDPLGAVIAAFEGS